MLRTTRGTLTAPGQSVIADNSDGSLYMTCQYTITNINTSVTLLLEASSDGIQWENIDNLNQTLVYNTNTTDSAYISFALFKSYRLTFVSELGGTAAVINVTFNLDT